MEILIGRNIKRLRKAREISQETLAEAMGVTVQAVSKWETEQSLPDVGLIPEIARFFSVTLDSLFFGSEDIQPVADIGTLPKNGKLYIVQAMNGKILSCDEWQRDKVIRLELGETGNQLTAEIWGNANIDGKVGGGIKAEGIVNCGNVAGGVVSDSIVNCGNVAGGVVADGAVCCGNVGGNVSSDESINCGNISGSVSGDGDIRCGDITNAETIHCAKLYAKGKITCDKIEGEVHTGESIAFDF